MKVTKKDIDDLFEGVEVVQGGWGVFEQPDGSVDIKRVKDELSVPKDKLEVILYILNKVGKLTKYS